MSARRLPDAGRYLLVNASVPACLIDPGVLARGTGDTRLVDLLIDAGAIASVSPVGERTAPPTDRGYSISMRCA